MITASQKYDTYDDNDDINAHLRTLEWHSNRGSKFIAAISFVFATLRKEVNKPIFPWRFLKVDCRFCHRRTIDFFTLR